MVDGEDVERGVVVRGFWEWEFGFVMRDGNRLLILRWQVTK